MPLPLFRTLCCTGVIQPGVPLRILGPLDSIFTRALLRGGGRGLVGLPLRTDHIPAESPWVEIAIAFSAEPCTRASNSGPGPRRSGPSPARVRQLNRITSPSPTRGCLFLSLLPNQIILFQLLKLFGFVCNGKVIIFRFSFL